MSRCDGLTTGSRGWRRASWLNLPSGFFKRPVAGGEMQRSGLCLKPNGRLSTSTKTGCCGNASTSPVKARALSRIRPGDGDAWNSAPRDWDQSGHERVLTRGWLRGTHRAVDPRRSKPWEPFHPHTKSERLVPGEICEVSIPIVPVGELIRAGRRIKLRISCSY